MDNPGYTSLSPGESEQFWADGKDARSAVPGKQPETSTTSISSVGAHGLCRHCSKSVKRNADGFWAHEDGVLCKGLFCAAEPIGIDMPGVGVMRPEVSPVELRSGRESAVGAGLQLQADRVDGALCSFLDGERLDFETEAPKDRRDRLFAQLAFAAKDLADAQNGERLDFETEAPKDRRDRLFAQLAFAAKDLADAQIEPADGPDEPAFCTECVEDEYRGLIAHEPGCRTGHVLGLIADLIGTLDLKPDLKEAAADEETPEADDGIRSHGLNQVLIQIQSRFESGSWDDLDVRLLLGAASIAVQRRPPLRRLEELFAGFDRLRKSRLEKRLAAEGGAR